jgi:hypothetical protein
VDVTSLIRKVVTNFIDAVTPTRVRLGLCAVMGARMCRDRDMLPTSGPASYQVDYYASIGFRCCGLDPPSP